VIVYMHDGAWLFTTTRRYWSNASRRYGQAGGTGQHASEGTLSGPVVRHRSVNLTYSTSILTRRGQDFDMLNVTRSLFTC
jgi:hypothetical protein